MKKYLTIIVAIVCLLFLGTNAFAVDLFNVGNADDDNNVIITSTGILEGARTSYEVFTTGDTLTAVESGKTCIFTTSRGTATGNTLPNGGFDLPDAALGLEFNFTVTTNAFVNVRPQDADTIKTLTGLDVGDTLTSPGATSDSIKLLCGAANTWYVSSMNGTWTDGGQY